jgi:hypothetical protein
MRYVLNGVARQIEAATVVARLRDVPPEPVREYSVRIGGVAYPVKQAFERASGVARMEFSSQTAARHLAALGFEVVATGQRQVFAPPASAVPLPAVAKPGEWPWEGAVQQVFGGFLRQHGWGITATADTATKERGVDLRAVKGPRRLGAEVKGWPSETYADPRRAAETEPTQPGNQAGHWFSQALFKAMLLLDSNPGTESLMVLPDFPRYRDLAVRTRTGRRAAGIHVVLLDPDGRYVSDSWYP